MTTQTQAKTPQLQASQQLPERLKILREALKLKQAEFGDLVGRDVGTISRWEGAKTIPSDRRLREIATRSGASLRWLSRGEGEMMADGQPVGDLKIRDRRTGKPGLHQVGMPFEPERMRAIIELVEKDISRRKIDERPSPAKIAGLILKFYEIEAEMDAPLNTIESRIIPFLATLKVG